MTVLQVSRPADLLLDCLEGFHQPVGGDHRAAHGNIAFAQGVLHPQIVRIHPNFAGDTVHVRFDGEGHVGDTGGAVRADVNLIGVHPVGAQPEIGHVVGSDAVTDARIGSGAQVSAHIEYRVGLSGHDGAVPHHAGPDVVGHRQARAVHGEHFLAGVHQLHRSARFHRQQSGESLEGQPQFGAETAAEFHGNHADPRHRDFKRAGQRGPDLIGALSRSVNDQPAVGLHISYARHGFEEALVDALGTVYVLHYYVRIRKRLIDVAPVGVQQRADVVPQRKPVSLVVFQFRVHCSSV